MENYDKALNLQQVSLNSTGSAMEKFNIYQESATASSERLKNAFQKLFMDVDSSFIKSLINFGSGFLTLIQNIGGLRTILAVLSVFLLSKLPLALLASKNALTNFMATASTATLGLGALGIALTAISIIWGVVASNNEKANQAIQDSFQNLDDQIKKMSDLKTQIDGIANGTDVEAKKRADLIEIIKGMNSEYEVEAQRLTTVNELRDLAIQKMQEEGKVAAEEFRKLSGQKYTEGKEFLSGTNYQGANGKLETPEEALISLSKQIDILNKKREAGTLSASDQTALNMAMSIYKATKAKVDEYKALIKQYDEAGQILSPNMNRDVAELRKEQLSSRKSSTSGSFTQVKTQEQLDKEAEEAQKALDKLNKIQEEYLDRQISLKLKAIDAEKKASEDFLDNEIKKLQTVNDERQNELDLMKAKDALLNAQTQKRAVYRAGVGFVYETDKKAIAEAQANIDKMNTDKQISSLQAQKDSVSADNTKETQYRNALLEQMKSESRPGMQDVYAKVLGLIRGADDHWYDGDGNRAFMNGGLAGFTGTAKMHGTYDRPELVLNNPQASALFSYIQGLTNPSISRNGLGNTTNSKTNSFAGAIFNLNNVHDPKGFINELERISKNR